MKVLITEKPSVAMEFAKVLKLNTTRKNGYIEGNEWVITWCVGHLVTMSYPEKYDENLKRWTLNTLPFLPEKYKYEVIPAVEKQFNVIKGLLTREDVTEIYIATDSGREGEYIYRLVDDMVGVPDSKIRKRVWIDSQTEEEILKGIREAKGWEEYDSLSASAYLRAKEDYLIGINFSRLLSIIYGRRIAKDLNEDKISISDLAGKKGKVLEVKKSKQKENAPLLFNLAEIQNECTKNFKIKPDETLEIIQELYEKKLVTYPRTDARVLSTAIAKVIGNNLNGIYRNFKDEEIHGYVDKMIKEKYSTDLIKTKYVNDSKITDHYAIIPTGQGFENYDKLDDLKKNVYRLIVKRFIAIFYPPAEYSKVSASVEVEKELFTASGKVCLNQGYLEVLKNKTKDQDSSENLTILANLKKGQEIEALNYEIKEAETTPPSRYNSGSMILAMENAGKLIEDEALREQIKGAGIGTSATRAEIIKKLERIQYIEINSKTQIITPTQKGEMIYDITLKTIPDMLNPNLTASWEKGLDMVAKKEIDSATFMNKLEKYIRSKIDKLVVKY